MNAVIEECVTIIIIFVNAVEETCDVYKYLYVRVIFYIYYKFVKYCERLHIKFGEYSITNIYPNYITLFSDVVLAPIYRLFVQELLYIKPLLTMWRK